MKPNLIIFAGIVAAGNLKDIHEEKEDLIYDILDLEHRNMFITFRSSNLS